MKNYKLTYTQNSVNDINNIFDFIAADNFDKAVDFTDYIRKELLKLKCFPRLGTSETLREPILPNSRKLIIKKYIAHYTIYEAKKRNCYNPNTSWCGS